MTAGLRTVRATPPMPFTISTRRRHRRGAAHHIEHEVVAGREHRECGHAGVDRRRHAHRFRLDKLHKTIVHHSAQAM